MKIVRCNLYIKVYLVPAGIYSLAHTPMMEESGRAHVGFKTRLVGIDFWARSGICVSVVLSFTMYLMIDSVQRSSSGTELRSMGFSIWGIGFKIWPAQSNVIGRYTFVVLMYTVTQ